MSNTWRCRLMAAETFPDGRQRKIDKAFDGSGDVYAAATAALRSRRDKGRGWEGCGAMIYTPLHNLLCLIEPDASGEPAVIPYPHTRAAR